MRITIKSIFLLIDLIIFNLQLLFNFYQLLPLILITYFVWVTMLRPPMTVLSFRKALSHRINCCSKKSYCQFENI